MASFPRLYDGVLTDLVSVADQSFEVFNVDFLPHVSVDPTDKKGKIYTDRAILDSTAGQKDLARGPFDEHPLIELADGSTVDYEVVEKASPRIQGAYTLVKEGQDPVDYEARRARVAAKAALMRRYIDVKDLLTTAANWTHNSTLAALTNGSGNKVSDLTNGDILHDVQAMVEAYQKHNGYADPGMLVLPITSLQFGIKQTKVRNALPDDTLRREGVNALISHIETLTGVKVFAQKASVKGSSAHALIWPDSWILLPPLGTEKPMPVAGGALLEPAAAALVHSTYDAGGEELYIKKWDRPDGNVFECAAVMHYHAVKVDGAAAYLATDAE